MFSENPERIFKEKRFSPNYKVLNLNDSHIVPLEDLYEENVSKKQDYPNGKTIYFRALTPNEEAFLNKNNSLVFKPFFLLIALLTFNTILISR